jgi:hypothetical protein
MISHLHKIRTEEEVFLTDGVHSFWKAEKDLPVGIVPSVIKSWNEAVSADICFLTAYCAGLGAEPEKTTAQL